MEAGGREAPQNEEQGHPKKCSGSRTLVVGHYCHDVIKLSSGNQVQALGGSVSYITNVLDALGLQCRVVSKVGSDFSYASAISHSPSVIEGARTTQFFADFTGDSDRVLRVPVACEPILPSDIPSHHPTDYAIGLAVGVAREILPETLRRMVEVSNLVVVDAQALIRTIHPVDGTVGLRSLAETDFYELLDQISFLKASSLESPYVDIEAVRRKTCVLVTEGDNGCRVFERDREFHVPAFPAEEVDPTGAGDSFLAGFSAGLIMGLTVEDAVLAGNFFGSVTVGQIGVPQFTEEHLQVLFLPGSLLSFGIAIALLIPEFNAWSATIQRACHAPFGPAPRLEPWQPALLTSGDHPPERLLRFSLFIICMLFLEDSGFFVFYRIAPHCQTPNGL